MSVLYKSGSRDPSQASPSAAPSRTRLGLALSFVAAAAFGTSGSFGESLISSGWSPAGAVVVRISLAALILTIPALLSLRGQWSLLRRSVGLITTFGLVAVAFGQVAYFNAVSRLSVGVALLLEYLGVILVVLWLWLHHDQRPRRLTVFGAVAAMIGLAFVLNLTGSHRLDPIGVLWGLGAAVGLAMYFALAAKADEPLPPIALAWAAMIVAAVALYAAGAIGLVSLRTSSADVHFAGHQVMFLIPVIGLSVIAGAFAYVVSMESTRILGAKLASFVGLTEVLFAVLFAWILLGQLPGRLQVIGGLFIIGGVVLVRIDELGTGTPPVTLPGESIEQHVASR
jgi:drug/metabolite transporter (DMT)-like permease